MFSFDEKKILFAKKLLISNPNRGVYSDVFNLFKDEIKKLIDFGLKYKSILSLLEKDLDCSLNYKTFISWINKNIKQKNQNSNNLKINTKKDEVKKDINNPKKEISKQNNTTSTTPNTPKKEDDGKPWWEKRLEELSKGMEEAGIRR